MKRTAGQHTSGQMTQQLTNTQHEQTVVVGLTNDTESTKTVNTNIVIAITQAYMDLLM